MEEQIINDDASLWKKNRELGIEEFQVPEEVEVEPNFYNPDEGAVLISEEVTAKDVQNDLNKLKLSEPTARLIVSIMDVLVPAIGVFITKDRENKEVLKLDDDEQKTLEDAFANYLKETELQMSPGVLLITAISAVYIPKFADLKIKKRENEYAAQNGINPYMWDQRNRENNMDPQQHSNQEQQGDNSNARQL